MKKIAIVNDLSGMGKCSLTAAIPVISAMGVQACPLPTAILSNQTDYETYFLDDYTNRMDRIIDEWQRLNFKPDGIYTGYLANVMQFEKVQRMISLFSDDKTIIVCDPVLGDEGETYDMYHEELRLQMCHLIQKANLITPNLTEALLLTGDKSYMKKQWQKLQHLSEKEYLCEIELLGYTIQKAYSINCMVITGIALPGKQIGNLVFEQGISYWINSPKYGGSYSGTGDLFSSVLAAGLTKGYTLKKCVETAIPFLSKAIAETIAEGTPRNEGICFEHYLHLLYDEII
ncbi:MAG: pyridoxamine kinase [Blautia sp.]|nr:pyridoxamine kinase [Blautia sp.]